MLPRIRHINQLTQLRDREESEREIIVNRMIENTQHNYKRIEEYKTHIFSIN